LPIELSKQRDDLKAKAKTQKRRLKNIKERQNLLEPALKGIMQHTKSDKQVLAKFKQSHFPTVIEFLNSSNKGEEATNHLESLEIPSLIASLKKDSEKIHSHNSQKFYLFKHNKTPLYSHCKRLVESWLQH